MRSPLRNRKLAQPPQSDCSPMAMRFDLESQILSSIVKDGAVDRCYALFAATIHRIIR